MWMQGNVLGRSPWHPLGRVTIETGQRVGLFLKQQELSGIQSLCLPSIYKVIHSLWQRLLRRRAPHFHDNRQNIQLQRKPSLTAAETDQSNEQQQKLYTWTHSSITTLQTTSTQSATSLTECRLQLNPYQLFARGLLNNPLCNKRTQSCMAVDPMSDDYD